MPNPRLTKSTTNVKKDYEKYNIAARLGRLFLGHPYLLHVDLSHCQLSREELFYIVLCVRDSKNIQGFHLTGNEYNHYDRLLMRALMPCKVRWPQTQSMIPRFEKISGNEKTTLIMLNMCFLSSIPPNFIPEIGLSNVTTVEEVRDRVRSHELKRHVDEVIERDSSKEF